MFLPKIQSILFASALCVIALPGAFGQTQDNSQNALLKGSYHFRHLAVQNVDASYNPTDITATYGTIVFDGAGNYTLTGTTLDNVATSGASKPLSVTGTYAIGSNGTGYITNPLFETDANALIYGAVAQGVYTGSSTEAENNGNYLNDIFVAIPASATAPTNASFTNSYQTGVLDFAGANSNAIKNALFSLSPDGKGAFGTITLNGQVSNSNGGFVNVTNQTVAAATYNFNTDGSATLTIPAPSGSSAALFTGSKTIYESADGNFILGWTSGGYDIFFGVKSLTASATNLLSQGLYFTAALEDIVGGFGTDSYYGSTNNSGNAAGDGILHQRLNVVALPSEDYGSDDQIVLNANGSAGPDFNSYSYLFGASMQAFVAIGTNGYFSLVVGMHAPPFSGPGVYLNPIGVVNAANLMPVTASIAPGELLDLFGTGLAPQTLAIQGGQPFPTTGVGGVTVTINGIKCPIYLISSTQLSVAVPYAVANNTTALANVQVNNNGVLSNVVQLYLTDAVPGAFSVGANGIGFAAATHAATGQLITQSNPVKPNEIITLYLTGLGTVTPAITDGAVASSTTLSYSDLFNSGNLHVNFNDFSANGTLGNQGTVGFAGLVPTLAGLYQINVTVPSTGLGVGDDVYVELMTDAADVNEVQIPYGAGAPTPTDVSAKVANRLKVRTARISTLRAKTTKTHKSRTHPELAPATN